MYYIGVEAIKESQRKRRRRICPRDFDPTKFPFHKNIPVGLSLLDQVCGCMMQLMPVVSTFRDTGGGWHNPPHIYYSAALWRKRPRGCELRGTSLCSWVAFRLATCSQQRCSPPGAPKRFVSPREERARDFNRQRRNRRMKNIKGFEKT